MNADPTDGSGAPPRWFLAFSHYSERWWVRLIPGRFKHVKAFGYCHETDCWVFFDPCLRTGICTARGTAANRLLARWSENAVILAIEPASRERIRFLPFACTTALASLLGLPGGALLPDALFRQCLRHGAQTVDGSTKPANDC